MKLAPLVFVRPGELRAARWEEFDLDAREPEWRIPAVRMKMRELHIVPLSTQAVAILGELRPLTGHGFRTIASTLLNEQGWNPDLIELQLAHAERDAVRDAYNRAPRADDPEKFIRRTCIAPRWRCNVRRSFYKPSGSGIWLRKPTVRQQRDYGKHKGCIAISAIEQESKVTELGMPSRENAWRLIATKAIASARLDPQRRRIWDTAMAVAASSRASMHVAPDCMKP